VTARTDDACSEDKKEEGEENKQDNKLQNN